MNNENSEDWIKHDGGPCPVDGAARLDLKFRDGDVWDDFKADTVDSFFDHGRPAGFSENDVVAYRVVKP